MLRPEGPSLTGRAWRWREVDEGLALALSQRLGLDDLVGRILAGRGIGLEQAPHFLEPRLRDWLPDPSHLLDLDRAVHRIADAVDAGDPIGLIGDYDVDGATSTALAARYLRAVGATVEVEIPDRLLDGYGPNSAALERLAAAGCQLVLTLDSGTTAYAPLAAAAADGQDVIIVDHHAAEAQLPRSFAVVNPNRLDQESPIRHLAAVGVTFLLLVGLGRELKRRGRFATRDAPDLMARLDLVALGTVCDVVPLTGLNRAFVRQGLKVAQAAAVPGFGALLGEAAAGELKDAWQLGFVLGPRINAGGRIGSSALGAQLLMTDDVREAAGIAALLERLNRERRQHEQDQLAAAERMVEAQVAEDRPVLVAHGEGWHPGVLGIVAARLMERHRRPVVVIGFAGSTGKGSGRSPSGYDLGAAVIAARNEGLLEQGGGHAKAAGLTMTSDRLPAFIQFLCERATGAGSGTTTGTLRLDAALSASGLQPETARALATLAPFGEGNDEPRLCLIGARVVDAAIVGEQHVRCRIAGIGGKAVSAIAFRSRANALGAGLLRADGPLHLAGKLRLETWRGEERLSFHIDDATPAA